MKLEDHPFFKKYRVLKYILLAHLAFSLFIFVSHLVHGITDRDILRPFEITFENYKAFHDPQKYLKKEFFVVDTAFIATETSSSQGKSTFKDITVIRGNLLNSTKKQELIYRGFNGNFFNDNNIFNENIKTIKVWRNIINDEVFLGNEQEFERKKDSATGLIYFYFSLIPLIIILLILKKKSEKQA
ncbi:hypothetical protein IRZ83_04535 [Flavobacterium sp. JLP]|uniref:hypothetical protein n=1 Tax=Flavobacterium sp. JLP TaxID=2783793 RepID=UPI00188D1E06|nr:hypothetical protein [Flavobacterium sp. JLP]MBF4505925.1 hypothetical protein [Flavobacterium sp. JLP]